MRPAVEDVFRKPSAPLAHGEPDAVGVLLAVVIAVLAAVKYLVRDSTHEFRRKIGAIDPDVIPGGVRRPGIPPPAVGHVADPDPQPPIWLRIAQSHFKKQV